VGCERDEEEQWVPDCSIAEDIVAGNSSQHGVRDVDSYTELCARHIAGDVNYGFGNCVFNCGATAAGGGFFCLSDPAFVADVVSPFAEYCFKPHDPAQWTGR
jgi:hypothetical protein